MMADDAHSLAVASPAKGSQTARDDRGPLAADTIRIRGAREHNLRQVDVDIPLRQLVVITGVSGSGKSSLAVQTLAAGAQHQIVESLVSTRQRRLLRRSAPAVDLISHCPPPVVVRCDRSPQSFDARSTVAALLGVEAPLAGLFVSLGEIVCPQCDVPVADQSPHAFVQRSMQQWPGRRAMIAYTLSSEQLREGPAGLLARGYVRIIRGDAVVETASLDKFPRKARIDAIVDRIVLDTAQESRVEESIELAQREGQGECLLLIEARDSEDAATTIQGRSWHRRVYSRVPRCPQCQRTFAPISPALLNVFTALGACSGCRGTGRVTSGAVCPTCDGRRLSSDALSVKIDRRSLADVLTQSPQQIADWLATLGSPATAPADRIRATITHQLSTFYQLNLSYLPLDRAINSLSAGEVCRVLLARAASTDLAETLLIVEEPSAGLHPADVPRLLAALRRPLSTTQSVIVIDHDPEVTAAADHVIEMGPGAGQDGGRIVAQGSSDELLAIPTTATSQAWSVWRQPFAARPVITERSTIELSGIRHRNLRDVTLTIPVGGFTAITGVAGSGKTSVIEALSAAFAARGTEVHPANPETMSWERLDAPATLRCTLVEATPLTSSPRSTVVTWLKAFDDVREVFAETRDARQRGWTAGHFSFFSPQGLRCPACSGLGTRSIELDLMPDVELVCPACRGSRYRDEVREVRYRGLSIVDVLQMTVAQVLPVFRTRANLSQRFQALAQLGLDYLLLGQPASQLSGGEAQRIRLASRLATRSDQPHLYLCDEPSAGLHTLDVKRLSDCCRQLTELGQTVVVVDNHRQLLESADWIIELGPSSGADGGTVVAAGAPADLAAGTTSLAGRILRGERFVEIV